MPASLYRSLLKEEEMQSGDYTYIDPPFNFNAKEFAQYPPEATGGFLLNSLARRIGWDSLTGKRLLDFGCGVRLARTLFNLGFDHQLYAGVDANRKAISWLRANIADPRFRFEYLDMHNPMYNPTGSEAIDAQTLQRRGLVDFDAACMFSVITHQTPEDAQSILSMLYPCVKAGGSLYFTALIRETEERYFEGAPQKPCLLSTYDPDFLLDIVARTGWIVEQTYERSPLQQAGFVCRKPVLPVT